MSQKKPKVYVVWLGRRPGIYHNWREVQEQTSGFKGAKFKSFNTVAEAEAAFRMPWQEFYEAPREGMTGGKKKRTIDDILDIIEVNSISVDAACSGNPGKMEYRGVWTVSGEEIFRSEVYPVGTNNIGEFLALVHALAFFSEKKPDLTIYSDSRLAMGWIEKKKCRSKLPVTPTTEKLWQVVKRGEQWLRTHSWENPIRKWETKEWGEIPADFGRK